MPPLNLENLALRKHPLEQRFHAEFCGNGDCFVLEFGHLVQKPVDSSLYPFGRHNGQMTTRLRCGASKYARHELFVGGLTSGRSRPRPIAEI